MGDTTASEVAVAGRPSRDALVAELNALTDSDAPAAVATPVSPADDHPIGDGDSPNDGEPAAGVDEVDPAEAGAEVPPPATKIDPDTAKRIAAAQKQEEHARKQLARDRAELDKQRAEIAEQAAALAKYEAAKRRAKYDPAAVLAELGLTDDDMEPAARALYARTKAAAADPKVRAAADAAAREREYADKLSATERRLAELEASLQDQTKQARQEQAVNAWLDSATKTVSDDAPLLKQALAKSPQKTRQSLFEVADLLAREIGEPPDVADVHAAWEARRRAELEEYGLDVSSILAKKPAAPIATAKPKTLGAVGTSTTPPAAQPALSPAEQRAALIRELEQLDKASA